MENKTRLLKNTGRKADTDKTRLYEFRIKANISQKQLGKEIHATQRAVSKFETTGEGLGMTKVLAICRLVNADIRDLIPEH